MFNKEICLDIIYKYIFIHGLSSSQLCQELTNCIQEIQQIFELVEGRTCPVILDVCFRNLTIDAYYLHCDILAQGRLFWFTLPCWIFSFVVEMASAPPAKASPAGRAGVRAAVRAQVLAHQANNILGTASQTRALGDRVATGQNETIYSTAMALETRAAPLPVVASYNVVVVSCSQRTYLYQTIMALVLIAALMPVGLSTPSAPCFRIFMDCQHPHARLLNLGSQFGSCLCTFFNHGHWAAVSAWR